MMLLKLSFPYPGTWSGDASGTASGTTNGSGIVTFGTGNLNDGSSVTFHIREGLHWSDGEVFDANDIEWWWTYYMTYTPDPDFFGADSFTYTVCDPGGLCDVANVSVTVDPVNDAPVASDGPTPIRT